MPLRSLGCFADERCVADEQAAGARDPASDGTFRRLAEHAGELLIELGPRGDALYVSPSVRDVLGHEPELWYRPGATTEMIHPDDRERVVHGYAGLLRSGGSLHVLHRVRHRAGHYRWVEDTARAVDVGSERRIVVVARDVTDHREIEEQIERQLWIERQIASFSRRFLALGADDLDAALEEALVECASIAAAPRAYLFSIPSGGHGMEPAYYEFMGDGSPGWNGAPRPYFAARLLAGEVIHFLRPADLPPEAALEQQNLRERGIAAGLSIPILRDGEIIGVFGFERTESSQGWSPHEITLLTLVGEILTSAIRRKQTEAALRESEARLSQAQKLEAVGRLAGGIAHDFNNLLTVILGFSRPLLSELAPEDPARDDVLEIHDAAERAAGLTRQLLTFSRRQVVESTRVDLDEKLAGLEPLLRRMLGEDVRLVVERAEALDAIEGDPHQFEQVVMNLAANARDAMPDGGELRIVTSNQSLGREAARTLGVNGPGRFIRLVVSDTGQGMDDATRAQIFDPFFTTKDPGQGTGLGLSIVYSVIERLGGAIEVAGGVAKGTTFTIWLPATHSVAITQERASLERAPGGTETVLLVEDEPAVRRVLRGILEDAGYDVLVAGDGEEALDRAAAFGGPIHALVSDVVMPRLGGVELAQRLAELQPELAVLFVSGYPAAPDASGLQNTGVLAKPFTAEALRMALRKALADAIVSP
jgi:PAS domain S-box-containing protein